jgi:hypothetical protein
MTSNPATPVILSSGGAVDVDGVDHGTSVHLYIGKRAVCRAVRTMSDRVDRRP